MSYIARPSVPCPASDTITPTPTGLADDPFRPDPRSARSNVPGVDARPASWLDRLPAFEELCMSYDPANRILWQMMTPLRRPSFTISLLYEMLAGLDLVEDAFATDQAPVEFVVLGSNMPGIFNLGGDLPHFRELIERRDRATLLHYAHTCVKVQYRRCSGMNLPICSIALVQGDALGGGFEAALANDVIIAERSAQLGLPEILFNLFPGMGAFSFLSRRLDIVRAEKMMLSGRLYGAVELHDMGVVDHLVEDGTGVAAVEDFVREFGRTAKARKAILKARRTIAPVGYDELLAVTDTWVDAALSLDDKDLRKMNHLAKAQDRRWARVTGGRQLAAE